jgi:hypothetical protein
MRYIPRSNMQNNSFGEDWRMTRSKRNWNAINRYAYKRWRKARHTKREYELFWLTIFHHVKMPEMRNA